MYGRSLPFDPVMDLSEISAGVPSFCIENYPVSHEMPFHGREIRMTLDCLA